MNVPAKVGIIDALDPNAPATATGTQLAIVTRTFQELKNKDLSFVTLAEKTQAVQTATDDIVGQEGRVPVITNDEVAGRAGALLKTIKNKLKEVADTRLGFTRPVLSFKEKVDECFTDNEGRLATAKTSLEQKILTYTRAKAKREAEAAEAERKRIQEETARLAAEANSKKEAAAITEAGQTLVAAVTAAPVAVESHGVKTGTAAVKNVKVTDLKLLLAFLAGEELKGEDISHVVEIKSRALNAVIRNYLGDKFVAGTTGPGFEVTESDSLRSY